MKRLIMICVAAGLMLVAFDARAATSNDGLEGSLDDPPSSSILEGRNILVYWDPYKSDGLEKDNVVSILQNAGAIVTQTTTSDAATLASQLVGKDAFVIAELIDRGWVNSSDLAVLNARFTSFKPALTTFLQGCNPVIVTEGDLDIGAGIQVINSLAWTSVVGGSKQLDTVSLTLNDPADPMLVGVSSLNTANGWMGFTSTDPLLNSVASYGTEMVLASKIVNGGYFDIIGFDYYSYNTNMATILVNASAVPEPATLLLLGLGGLALIKRRR